MIDGGRTGLNCTEPECDVRCLSTIDWFRWFRRGSKWNSLAHSSGTILCWFGNLVEKWGHGFEIGKKSQENSENTTELNLIPTSAQPVNPVSKSTTTYEYFTTIMWLIFPASPHCGLAGNTTATTCAEAQNHTTSFSIQIYLLTKALEHISNQEVVVVEKWEMVNARFSFPVILRLFIVNQINTHTHTPLHSKWFCPSWRRRSKPRKL